jgi:hypothetical protein
MAPIRVRVSPGFPSGAGFPERNLIQGGPNYREHLKIREKMLSGKSCSKTSKEIHESTDRKDMENSVICML